MIFRYLIFNFSENFQIQHTEKMKQNKKQLIGLVIIYLILMLGIALLSAMINKESIKNKSNIAFLTAIKQEKALFIQRIIINLNSSTSTIPVEERIDWGSQSFLIMEDSCRHRLDSIFREEVKNQGLNLNTSISYTCNGKNISHAELKSLKGVRIIHEKIYRKDNKKENDIILKAYVYLPFNVLIGSTTLYVLLLLNIVGLAAYIYRRKTNKPKHCPIKTETRTTDNNRWIIINKDLLWDENNCLLKKGEKTIILKGESLRFFKLFLKSESFFLKYTDIYGSYGLKNESPEFKDRIYHSIKELRKDLTDFGMNIKAVRSMGYRLTFH